MQWTITLPKELNNFHGPLRVTLGNPRWDDFGFNYHAVIELHYKHECLVFHLYVMPFDVKNEIFNRLADAPPGELTRYISLLRDPATYQYLASNLDDSDYNALLHELRELSAAKSLGSISQAELNDIASLEPFRLGVLRRTNAYLSIVRGYESSYVAEAYGDTRVDFSFSMILPGTNEWLSLSFIYKDHRYFEDRIHCLIGVNGVGKTQFLSGLIGSIAQRCGDMNQHAPLPGLAFHAGSKVEQSARRLDVPDGFYFNRVLAYSSDAFTMLPMPGKPSSFDYQIFNSADPNASSEYGKSLSHLLLGVLRDVSDAFNERAWAILCSSLESLIPMERLAIPVTDRCPEGYYFTDQRGERWCNIDRISGENRSLDIYGTVDPSRPPSIFPLTGSIPVELSSGQRVMFRFALHFLTHASYGALLVIDEPETYLHPNLISDYMMLLYRILTATGSTAIIATHSAYVVRELPKHCVHVLQRDGEKIVNGTPYLNTLGASVSEISAAVFGDSTANAYHRKITQLLSESDLSFEEVLDGYRDIFNLNMLMEISDLMDDVEGRG
ncbi:ATP-binding protein [Pseudomonas sp. HN11]|uniref:AAA family ATPase n=1 Tax=Pseudomonas sp. HN11 TaxID=1344094 RepID=UPI001F2DE8F7|nr:AAA family ATPase [Pseudomonas sp. HN11]UII73959.1 ATP-binding protein [Pseudomonas sp. HN11]